jgi:hypothetical protein
MSIGRIILVKWLTIVLQGDIFSPLFRESSVDILGIFERVIHISYTLSTVLGVLSTVLTENEKILRVLGFEKKNKLKNFQFIRHRYAPRLR